jgi:hypothetical protein
MKDLIKTYVLGGSGVGKTTMLVNIEAQGLRIARNFTTRKRRENEGLLEYYFVSDICAIELKELVYVNRYYQGYYGLTVGDFLKSDVIVAAPFAMVDILAWIVSECILRGISIQSVVEESKIFFIDAPMSVRVNRLGNRDGVNEMRRRLISESWTFDFELVKRVWSGAKFEYINSVENV